MSVEMLLLSYCYISIPTTQKPPSQSSAALKVEVRCAAHWSYLLDVTASANPVRTSGRRSIHPGGNLTPLVSALVTPPAERSLTAWSPNDFAAFSGAVKAGFCTE